MIFNEKTDSDLCVKTKKKIKVIVITNSVLKAIDLLIVSQAWGKRRI